MLRVNGEVRGLIRLWKSVENSKAEPFTKTVKDAAPRQGSLLHPFKNGMQIVSSQLHPKGEAPTFTPRHDARPSRARRPVDNPLKLSYFPSRGPPSIPVLRPVA